MHLSRWAEDLILWSSREFGFVMLADAYSTGSSLMPQKKNPDALELLRGKTGRLMGNLTALLTLLKGLPSSYDKDLQEDKEPLFDAVDTLALALPVAQGVLADADHPPRANARGAGRRAAGHRPGRFAGAPGVPFRQSHHLVGQAVRRAEELGCALRDVPLADCRPSARTSEPTWPQSGISSARWSSASLPAAPVARPSWRRWRRYACRHLSR